MSALSLLVLKESPRCHPHTRPARTAEWGGSGVVWLKLRRTDWGGRTVGFRPPPSIRREPPPSVPRHVIGETPLRLTLGERRTYTHHRNARTRRTRTHRVRTSMMRGFFFSGGLRRKPPRAPTDRASGRSVGTYAGDRKPTGRPPGGRKSHSCGAGILVNKDLSLFFS